MTNSSVVGLLLRELGLALDPIERIDSPDVLRKLLYELGWQLPSDLSADLSRMGPAVADLRELIFSLDGVESREDYFRWLLQSADQIQALVRELRGVGNTISQAIGTISDELADIGTDLFPRLFDYLIVEHLHSRRLAAFSLLQLCGIIELGERARSDGSRLVHRVVHWANISKLVSDPSRVFDTTYGWSGEFAADRFLGTIDIILRGFGILGGTYDQDEQVSKWLICEDPNSRSPSLQSRDGEGSVVARKEVRIPLLQGGRWPATYYESGIAVSAFPKLAGPPELPPGIAIIGYLLGLAETQIQAQLSEGWQFEFRGAAGLQGGIAVLLCRDKGIRIVTNVFSDDARPFEGRLEAQLRPIIQSDTELKQLFGSGQGSGLGYRGLGVRVVAEASAGKWEYGAQLEVEDLTLSVRPDNPDGFIAKLLDDADIDSSFDITLGWSSLRGVHFGASGSFEIVVPIGKSLGPLTISSVHLGIRLDDGIRAALDTSFSATLSPIAVSVERLGLEIPIQFPENRDGNFGPLDVGMAFRPPSGVGLAIDGSVVKGGGYLAFNEAKQEYSGALELAFSDFLTVKAIGLITTRMPDGSKGFALLAVITAEFGAGIQVGFGFRLLGVGGLLGLNRTLRMQALLDGVRTGSIDGIMFPRDVIANAPRIVSDLAAIFPPEEGHFLFGPMAKLGWGTPTLISLSLGIVIEIPGNVTILGVLRAALPKEQAPILLLQVNFAGTIEFDKKRVYFFAALFESRILDIAIEGEMGLLMAYGADANFVLTVGGFHPRFSPPALPFPVPRKTSLNVLNGADARISVSGYFAVTTNTVQFGANAELYFSVSAFEVEGFIAFDALLRFSPFYFIIDTSATVSVKAWGYGVFSVHLSFSLEGPTPWRARGTGSISLLFFDLSTDFDIGWGETVNTTLPPIEVKPLLKLEFEKDENWRALPPPGSNILVSLRKIETEEGLVLHPLGTLRVSQKAVPLDVTIERVGSQKPADGNCFSVEASAGPLKRVGDAEELFAPAQFHDMDDASKLSSPAFQPEHGGLELGAENGQTVASSLAAQRTVRYEEIILDTNLKRSKPQLVKLAGGLFGHFIKGASVSKSTLSKHHRDQRQPFAEKIAVKGEVYVVARQADNKAHKAEARFSSEARARDYLQQEVANEASLADSLHVIPEYELAA